MVRCDMYPRVSKSLLVIIYIKKEIFNYNETEKRDETL